MSALTEREKMLGSQPIGGLLTKMAVPATIAMLVNAAYSLIDRSFISANVGDLGNAGLTLAFPVQMMVMAFGLLFGIGGASLVSRFMGEKRMEDASRVAGNVFSMAALFGLLIGVIGFFNSEWISAAMAGFSQASGGTGQDIAAGLSITNAEAFDITLSYASEYLSIIFIGSFFMSMTMAMNNIVRAEGHAMYSMVIMVVGAVANIGLDALFIQGFGWGIAGAAWATVLGQILSFGFVMFYFSSGMSVLKMKLAYLVPKLENIKGIFVMGAGTFVRQIGGTALMLIVNMQLNTYGGPSYLTAYGSIAALVMMILMPIFGLGQGFQPIAGYNYGAKKMGRVRESVILTSIVATVFCSLAYVAIMLGAEGMMNPFIQSDELLDMTAAAMRSIAFVLPVLGLQVIGATFFQAIGRAFPSLFLSLSRQFIFLIPLLFILPPFMGVSGVWYSFPIADGLATLVTVVWTIVELRKLHLFDRENVVLQEAAAVAMVSDEQE